MTSNTVDCQELIMSINGVISVKLEEMDKVLGELESLGHLTPGRLQQKWQTKRAVERDLQVLVEIMIDVCQRILSLNDRQVVSSSAEAIERCQDLGIISEEVDYRKVVQFRNFVVHRYEAVEDGILCDICNNHLDDIRRFKKDVNSYVKNH